ncbi:MAG: leucine-rich repeat protein [Clostridia bacterium]|nr:leucine-rich repeat protein [Clostridia bacterium]
MKKTISIILALVMALSVFAVMTMAETPDFTYEVISEEDKTCKITGAKEGTVDLVIPEEIDGYKVVFIDNRAFWSNPEIETVQIADTVERIGQLVFSKTAFYKNEANWEDGVLYIGKFVIVAKTTLTGEYTIKEGTTVMADAAFRDRKELTKVVIPEGMTNISLLAFRGCEALAEVVIPSTVKSISGYAFVNCFALKTVALPEGLESIGLMAFNNCGLTEITIPASVEKIEDYAFCNSVDLAKIEVAEGNENFSSKDGILYDKEQTTLIFAPASVDYSNVTFPETVTVIGKGAFVGATFEEVVIPEGVTTIGEAAFEKCENLKKITIPASVTEIADNAFNMCNEEFCIDAPVGSYAYEYAQENDMLPDAIPGDVTGDGKVSAIDARWVLQYVAGMRAFTAKQFETADVNGDGKISAFDARKILQVAAGVQ